MQPEFSMRWILAGIAVVATSFTRPSYRAQQLVAEVNAGDYHQLDSLNVQKQLWQYNKADGGRYTLKELKVKATLHPWTWRDVRQFRRRVAVGIWPPPNAKENLPPQMSLYVFVRANSTKLGGEKWD